MKIRLTNAPDVPGKCPEFLDIEYDDGRSYFGVWTKENGSVVCELPTGFDITPEQYRVGIDKLWAALKLHWPQNKDVFTLVAERIKCLENLLEECRRRD